MKTPTVEECLRLLRAHHVLDSWDDSKIVSQILRSIEQNCLGFTMDENHQLTSICLGRWHDKCCIFVIAIAGYRGSLKHLFRHLRCRFPQVVTLRALRDGVEVSYKVRKFFKL